MCARAENSTTGDAGAYREPDWFLDNTGLLQRSKHCLVVGRQADPRSN
jgi:hypothetical protein